MRRSGGGLTAVERHELRVPAEGSRHSRGVGLLAARARPSLIWRAPMRSALSSSMRSNGRPIRGSWLAGFSADVLRHADQDGMPALPAIRFAVDRLIPVRSALSASELSVMSERLARPKIMSSPLKEPEKRQGSIEALRQRPATTSVPGGISGARARDPGIRPAPAARIIVSGPGKGAFGAVAARSTLTSRRRAPRGDGRAGTGLNALHGAQRMPNSSMTRRSA